MSEMNRSVPPRSVALVSGKGGSGKTMIAAVMAAGVASYTGERAILVDADTGTAGMSYYLGLELVANTRGGLSNVANIQREDRSQQALGQSLAHALQPVDLGVGLSLLPVGDHRRLRREVSTEATAALLHRVVRELDSHFDAWIIADCRGGIDEESLGVCRAADDIILVVEPDTTSFQATQHLVDVLSEVDLGHKLRGFIINKVFDDPTVVARNGTAVFGSQFLGAVPFDLEATRAFLVGRVPPPSSLFATHVLSAVSKAYPGATYDFGRTWRNEDFRDIGLTNLDSYRGGILAGGVMLLFLMIGAFLSVTETLRYSVLEVLVLSTGIWGLVGTLEPTRRAIGRAVSALLRLPGRRRYRTF